MKMNLKKYIALFLILSGVTASIFAQEAEDFEAFTEDSGSGSGMSLEGVRAGVYFGYTPVFGEMGKAITGNIGGGIAAEIDFLPIFGLGINVGANANPVKIESLKSVWNLQTSAKLFMRFNILPDFFLQPELNYGIFAYFPKKADGYYGEIASCYVDQFVQLGLAIRYSPSEFANGLLEFELCPYYIFSPEAGAINNFAGARAGVLFNF